MTYYLLPRGNLNVYHELSYRGSSIDYGDDGNHADHSNPIIISNSVAQYLYGMKENIDDKERKWDTFKKYTNPCEYIHTMVPFKKKSVAKNKPISRSYFKMIELLHIFPIFPVGKSSSHSHSISTFHLAEAPGGFIEAIGRTRRDSCTGNMDRYYGMTLLDQTDTTVPTWKKGDFMHDFSANVLLENGVDGTGNILSLDNFVDICSPESKKEYVGNMDIVTGDGGFDFSTDFNQQEIAIGKLLFAQIAYAACLQKRGGSFVLKIFDSFMAHTVDLIYLLTTMYEKVYIVKPQTSRYANSEKYLVCMGFLHDNKRVYPYFHACFRDMVLQNEENLCKKEMGRFMKIRPSFLFLQKMEEYNAIYAQKQMMNIQYTITLIESKNKHEKIENLIQTNVQKSTNWCIKYGVPYHTITFPTATNVFMHDNN